MSAYFNVTLPGDRRFYAPIVSRATYNNHYKGTKSCVCIADDLETLKERVQILYKIMGVDLITPGTVYMIIEEHSENVPYVYMLTIDKSAPSWPEKGPYMEGLLKGWYARERYE